MSASSVRFSRQTLDMRELTLLETGYLSGLVLLSLVLPLLMSFHGQKDAENRSSAMKTVWLGQGLGACAAPVVVASAPLSPYAAAFGFASCTCCVLVLLRQFRAVRTA